MMLEHPLLPSHPHPQFVAAKSLILKSSVDIFIVHIMWRACQCFHISNDIIFFGVLRLELHGEKNYAIVPMIVLIAVSFLLHETMTVYIESIEKR